VEKEVFKPVITPRRLPTRGPACGSAALGYHREAYVTKEGWFFSVPLDV
jgi:hypothetical protein